MNKKLYTDLKYFFLNLLMHIKPNNTISEKTPLQNLKLENIDFTLIAIECEEKYQIIIDEKAITNCLLIEDVLHYIYNILEIKNIKNR